MNALAKSSPESLCSVADIAADWLARRELGFAPHEQEEFSRWLLADPAHAAAVREMEASWRLMKKPKLTGQTEAILAGIELRVQAKARQRRALRYGIVGLAAAAAVVFAFLPARVATPAAPVAHLGKVEVRPERQILPDGSVVEFNAGARISVNFTPGRRDVQLLQGEAHFAVAHDTFRPFVVTAGSVTVKAVGTEFAVKFEPTVVDVLVTEGRVAVERIPPAGAPSDPTAVPPEPMFVSAGGRLAVATDTLQPIGVQPVSATDINVALAWRSLRVEFTDTPLSEVVTLFNKQSQPQLALGSEAIGEIRISGIFWADDPEGFSRLIEASAPLRAEHESNRIVLRSR